MDRICCFFFPFENTQCREMQEVVGCREMFQVGAERSGEKWRHGGNVDQEICTSKGAAVASGLRNSASIWPIWVAFRSGLSIPAESGITSGVGQGIKLGFRHYTILVCGSCANYCRTCGFISAVQSKTTLVKGGRKWRDSREIYTGSRMLECLEPQQPI